MSDYGYWTFGGKNGLVGAASTINVLPDGRRVLVKNKEFPAVLEDEFIIFALKNSRIARTQFNRLYPSLDEVSQDRLNTLLAKNGAVKRSLENPFFNQSAQDKADAAQHQQVVGTRAGVRGWNPYLEKPKPFPKPGSDD